MLQQTQVKTVIPYWERWMRELPTIESLAMASPDKIHKLWEGLGYYTRVRNMQKAAQQILSACCSRGHEAHSKNRQSAISNRQFKSEPPDVGCYKFPDTFDAVLALPGIGRYTAGAICSIAFNQPTPILDGNVIRVLTRIHGIKTDPRERQTNAQLWRFAEELVTNASQVHSPRSSRRQEAHSKSRNRKSLLTSAATNENACSHLNQSLMELGALICTPRAPRCSICPARQLCVARKENLQDQLPNLGKRVTTTERSFIAFIIERDGKFLVRQRPAGVVNAQLWEFPNVEIPGAPSSRRRVAMAVVQQHASETLAFPAHSPRLTDARPLCTIKHSITRYRITLEAWRAELSASNGAPVSDPARSKSIRNTPGRRPALRGEWRTLSQLHQLAFTSAHKKILGTLAAKHHGCNQTRDRKKTGVDWLGD